MSKVFYNAYTEKEKNKYKEIDERVENKFLDLYEKAHKKSREQALYFIIYGEIMLLCTLSGYFLILFNLFYFTCFYALGVVNFYVAYVSFRDRKNSKLYIISFILMLINVFFDLGSMFFIGF